VAKSPPTKDKDCTAAMGYCMAIDYDTGVSVSRPQPPQDGRWAIFVPASYKNMPLGEAQLSLHYFCFAFACLPCFEC
jgi:hypothetical protein